MTWDAVTSRPDVCRTNKIKMLQQHIKTCLSHRRHPLHTTTHHTTPILFKKKNPPKNISFHFFGTSLGAIMPGHPPTCFVLFSPLFTDLLPCSLSRKPHLRTRHLIDHKQCDIIFHYKCKSCVACYILCIVPPELFWCGVCHPPKRSSWSPKLIRLELTTKNPVF